MKKEDIIQGKIDKLKASLTNQERTSNHFYGRMVGFKNVCSKRRWEKSIDKELDIICELRYLEAELERLNQTY